MFYIILSMETKSANQISRELGRDYESVLNFVREVQELAKRIGGIRLEGICEADEVYLNSGDKGVKEENPRKRGLSVKGRGTYEGDRPPVMTLVRRSDGMTEFVVMNDIRKAVEEIRSRASKDCVIITDNYPAYDRLDPIGMNHMRINHSERYADGDIHVNRCENRHSFLRSFLPRLRGVSKRHLQEYLSFLALLINMPTSWFSTLLSLTMPR